MRSTARVNVTVSAYPCILEAFYIFEFTDSVAYSFIVYSMSSADNFVSTVTDEF